jgi:hypothetical protein
MKRTSIVPVGAAVAAGLLFVLSGGTFVVWRASRAMNSAVEDIRTEHEIRFAVWALAPVANADFEVISSPAVFFQTARFQIIFMLPVPPGCSNMILLEVCSTTMP